VKGQAIIRSGWWVALAAAVVTLVVGAVLVAPLFDRAPGSSQEADFDLTDTAVPRNLIVRAMNRDGVRALVAPTMVDAKEVDRFNREERGKMLVPDDRVIGIEISGDARAYPLRLMRWHEVVNDVVGGEPVAITYSPLCDSVAVFSREVEGEVVELGVSGLLYNSNTLLYDRRSGPPATPLWLQLDGHPVAGPAPRTHPQLALRPTTVTTWAIWRARHPATGVLAPLPEMKRLYKRDPYHSYFGSDLLRFPVDPLPPTEGLLLKNRLVIITVDGEDAAFPLPALAAAAGTRSGSFEVAVQGLPLRIQFDTDLGVADVEPLGDPDRLTAVRYSFWFAWYAIARTSHRLPTAGVDAPHPAGFSHFGVLDVLSSTTPRPARSGRSPQRRPLRAPWPRILGAATTALSFIAEERQQRRRGHAVATLRADGGRGRSLRCSSSTMLGHRFPPRALTSAREPHRRMALGAPAAPLGRKPHWARHLADLATKAGEKYGLGGTTPVIIPGAG